MPNLNFKKERVQASYKTIYLKDITIKQLEELAEVSNTSFNNIVTKILENYLDDEED